METISVETDDSNVAIMYIILMRLAGFNQPIFINGYMCTSTEVKEIYEETRYLF